MPLTKTSIQKYGTQNDNKMSFPIVTNHSSLFLLVLVPPSVSFKQGRKRRVLGIGAATCEV